MTGPYAVRITLLMSGEVTYFTGRSQDTRITTAKTWVGRDGAQNKADKLTADYGRARIAAKVEVIEI